MEMKDPFVSRTRKKKISVSIAAVIALSAGLGVGLSNIAFAQEDDEDEQVSLEEITITGSRIRRDDFSQAQPTTVIGRDMLDNLGIVNLGDALAMIPSNVPNTTPATNGQSNFFSGNNIANLRGLNPFFGSRTLTLVDSRRHVPTNQADSVDLNFIPSIIVERLETVTGGASASYGSGAIGGVQNIIMNRTLDGGKVNIDFATTAQGDGDDIHIGLAWGGDIGDSGHFVAAYESQDADEIGHCALDRDWCASNTQIATNNDYANNDQPNYILVHNVRQQDQNVNALFPLLGLKFNAAGTATEPYEDGGQYNVGGEGKGLYDETNLRSNVDREVVFLLFDYEFNDDFGFFAEASFGTVKTGTGQFSTLNFGFLPGDNAYRLQLGANDPCATFPGPCFVNKDFGAQTTPFNSNNSEVERYAVGFTGRFADTSWTWDAYYEKGKSIKEQIVFGNQHLVAFAYALDAVYAVDGDPNSGVVCRVTRDGVPPSTLSDPRLAEGCQPMNVFGTSNLSPGAHEYAFGQLVETTTTHQDILEGVASGELWEGFGAGPVLAAIGGSWRVEEMANISDPSQPDHIRTDYLIQYGESFGGEVVVFEYFTEVDIPFTDSFSGQAAWRRSEYTNTAGLGTGIEGTEFDYGITTWKVNGVWEATDWLTIRGSQSRDIRAPNFRELYYGQIIPAGSPFGYCTNDWTGNTNVGIFTFTGDPCTVVLKGGLSLQPETGDTTTFGIIVTPPQLNLRLAVDYYRIKIEDGINAASTGLTLDACFQAQDPFFCSQISGTLLDDSNPNGGFAVITEVRPEAFNFAAYNVEGLDISADWVGEYDFGTISMRFLAAKMFKQIVQPSTTSPELTQDISGVTGSGNPLFVNYASAPDWTANWTTTYNSGPVTATIQARFVAEGKIRVDRIGPEDSGYSDTVATSIYTNRIGNYVNWTLSGSYTFNFGDTELSLWGTVNNLFDRDPPVFGAGGIGGTNPVFYDTIGRNYRVGIRAVF